MTIDGNWADEEWRSDCLSERPEHDLPDLRDVINFDDSHTDQREGRDE